MMSMCDGYGRELRGVLVALVVLLAGALLLYARSFAGGWTLDDYPVIVDNPDLRSLGNFLANAKPGRPLRELSLLVDFQLFGLDPAGYRWQNIFWHGLNAWLLWLLAVRLKAGRFVAWGAALLFLAHPVMVEVVANSSHRKDSLALAFALLAVHGYLSFLDGGRWRMPALAGGIVAWLIACAAKQNAVVVPLVWLACEAVLVPRERRVLLRRPRLLVFSALAGLLLVAGWLVAGGGAQTLAEAIRGPLTKMNQASGWTLGGYYLAIFKAWSFMAWKAVWPVSLGIEYTFALPDSWLDPWVLAGLAMAAAVPVLLLLLSRRSTAGFIALAWLAALWLPTANLWPLAYLAADRYLYAPLAGGCLVLALAINRLGHMTGRYAAPVMLLLVLTCYAVLAWRQVDTWHDERALWTQAYRVSPTSAFALNNLGNLALERGEQAEALRFYQESFANNPYNPTSNYNLGFLYRMHGEFEASRKHLNNFLVVAEPHEYAEQRRVVERLLRDLPSRTR